MNEIEKDTEELDFLVGKLRLDNWNADFVNSDASLNEDGENMKIIPDE